MYKRSNEQVLPLTGPMFLFVKPTLNEELTMKKLLATLMIAGTAVTLAACDTTGTGNVETAAPYETAHLAAYFSFELHTW